MREVDIISSGDPAWQSTAKNLVSTELRPIQERLQKKVKRSSALSAMQIGIADMGYAAMERQPARLLAENSQPA